MSYINDKKFVMANIGIFIIGIALAFGGLTIFKAVECITAIIMIYISAEGIIKAIATYKMPQRKIAKKKDE